MADDFEKAWGVAPSGSSSPTNDGDFEATWGLAPSTPSAAIPTITVTAPKPQAAPAQEAIPSNDFTNSPAFQTYKRFSEDIARDPNAEYAQFWPLKRDQAGIHWAFPGIFHDVGQGVLDATMAPKIGTMTPLASSALAQLAPVTSVASGTGQAIAKTAAIPLLDRLTAAIKRAGGEPNPLEAPTAQSPLSAGATSASEAAGPQVSPAAQAAASQEAKEYAAIPEKLPAAPKIPPLTQSQADARADQLIKYFASKSEPLQNQDLVPGFTPTLAQRTNDPGIATLERGVQAANPGAMDLRKEANLKAVKDFTTQLIGTPEDVAAMQADRETATAPMRDAAFANKKDVDAAPVTSQIQSILKSPDGKRAAVRKTLQDVDKSLHVGESADKPLESDPEQLYGVRKHINDLLSPAVQRDNPELQRASGILSSVRDSLDDVIEQGAPGFKDYISQYAQLSRPIDEKQYLQGLNLTDQAGNVRGAAVDAALKGISKLQQAPGANKASSISDETMDALQRLHRTLQVARYTDTAGKALGSNTFQNLATNSTVGAVAGNPLAHLGLAGLTGLVTSGPVGAMVGAGANMYARKITGDAETMVRNAIIERLLNLQGKGEAAIQPKASLKAPMPPSNPLAAGSRPFA